MPRAEDYTTEQRRLKGTSVVVTTYRVGAQWHCTVASVEPGANIARADGATREHAVEVAISKAAGRIKTLDAPSHP